MGCWLVEISTSATLAPSLVTCALAYNLFITTFLFFLSQKNSSSLCLLAKGVRILYLLTTSLYRRDWELSSKSPLSPTFSWLASLTFEVTALYFHIWTPPLVVTMSMFLPPVPALGDCLASSFMPPAMFESMMRKLPLWWLMVRVMGFWAMLSLSNRLGALTLNWYGESTVFPEMSMTFCPSLTTSKLILNLRRRKFLLCLSMKSLKLLVLVWKAPKG